MSGMAVAQPPTRQHASAASRNLLNLDCSADLRLYRRNLGPGVQAKCFEKTSDTIRAQLDHHRAFLLRHRRDGRTSGLPSPVPRLEVPQAMPGIDAAATQMNVPTTKYHTASHPRPLQILSQPHAPQQAPSVPQWERPFPGNVSTYPVDLRRALEECARYEHKYEPHTVYEIVMHVTGERGEHSVIGSSGSLQEANLLLARMFLFEGYRDYGDDATYEVSNDGSLRVSVVAEGWQRGEMTITVERNSVRPGPKRR
ncbi:hypothetical protein C7974DRAFT_193736 [Boeremia exigua]|uniref:uncharacterized protein n=1 Tax=Boeremia exigua TaxID=749465 RepID=UPI001E8DC1D5|nr:uncharacterized protein C7974DRAFT_193736 [Boeremia exigua]KAH6629820.1 hypothetical protein C7974DRAFT_193736 [Boeremia exigua]